MPKVSEHESIMSELLGIPAEKCKGSFCIKNYTCWWNCGGSGVTEYKSLAEGFAPKGGEKHWLRLIQAAQKECELPIVAVFIPK